MIDTQQIKDIEARWEQLVLQRQQHYNTVLSEINPRYQAAIIKELNESLEYEQKFDAMEKELRKLDPSNSYLSENQENLY